MDSSSEAREKELRSFCAAAKQKLYNGDIVGAYKNFKKAENIHGCAYCKFLSGDMDDALVLLKLIQGINPAVDWLLCFINIINCNNKEYPTYFQIRNFYEADLNMLFFYKNFDCIRKILIKADYLSRYNKEIYKYNARVFIDNNLPEKAILFLKKSLEIYYKDPEVHFMLAEVYYSQEKFKEAKTEYEKANNIAVRYFPALNKLKTLGL